MTDTPSPADRLEALRRRQRLYALLPAVYRLRDEALEPEGRPLQLLLAVLEQEFERLERDVQGLYDDWFLDTCRDWVVPYIGDLVRARQLHPATARTANARAFVARTIEYRQRKGTVSVLEQLAHDVTGWPTRAVECFRLLATNQNLNHLRLDSPGTLSLHQASRLELLGSPFDTATRTVEVRRIEPGRGRYNLPSVALFAWRLRALPLEGAPPTWQPEADGTLLFRFDALGRDTPLFGPEALDAFERNIDELEVPGPLRPRALDDALKSGAEQLPFVIRIGGLPVAAQELEIGDLTARRGPPSEGKRARVDPRTGRFLLQPGVDPHSVRVDYSFGFSAYLGGGPYDRARALEVPSESAPPTPVSGGGPSLALALAAFVLGGEPSGVFEITDNEAYVLSAETALAAGQELTVRAANGKRPSIVLVDDGRLVRLGPGSALELSGLLVVCDALELGATGGQARVSLLDVTLAPFAVDGDCAPAPLMARAVASAGDALVSAQLELRLERAVTGPIRIEAVSAGGVLESTLSLADSIVDAGDETLALAADRATIVRSTVLGDCLATVLSADNALFTGVLSVQRVQEGCVRYSYVPAASRTARRHRCQPETAVHAAPPEARSRVLARVRPFFTSTRFGDPAYAELHAGAPAEITAGADDESELGAFHDLFRPQCLQNLQAALQEYLRFGLEAGLVVVNQRVQR